MPRLKIGPRSEGKKKFLVVRGDLSTYKIHLGSNLAVGERLRGIRFLIRDRDSKFSGPFDEVFRSEGVRIIKTPIRAPRANAYAERWVRTVRTDCLDWMLVLGRRHLAHVLRTYGAHYNGRRPHRGFGSRRRTRARSDSMAGQRRTRSNARRTRWADP